MVSHKLSLSCKFSGRFLKTVSSAWVYWLFSSWTSPSLASRKQLWLSSYLSGNFPQSLTFFSLSFTILWMLLISVSLISWGFLFHLLVSNHIYLSKPNKDPYRSNVSTEFHISPCLLYISLRYPTNTLNLAYLKNKSITKSLLPSSLMSTFKRLLLCLLCLF